MLSKGMCGSNLQLADYYRDGLEFLLDFMDKRPERPSKYDAINRARAEWAKERDV
jgi:hypothetical protein